MKLVFIFIVALATNSAAATEEPQQMALRHRTLCASKGSKGKSKGTGRMKKAGCDRKQSYGSYDGDDNDDDYYYYASRAAMSMSMNVALEDEEFFGENDGFSIYYNEGNAHDMMSKGKGKGKGNHNSSRSHFKGRASDGASEKSKSSKGTEGSFRPSKGAYRSSSGDKESSDGSKGIGRGYYSDATSRSFGKGEFRSFASKGKPVGKGSGGSGGTSSSKGSGGSYYSAKSGEKSFSSRSSKGSYSGRSQEGPWKGNYYSVKKSYNSYQGGFQEREGSEEVPSNDHD